MAKISRALFKIFGLTGSNDNFEQFGSETAGAAVYTKDIETIQNLDAWVKGWQNAVNPSNKAPFLEDMNAKDLVFSTAIAYLFQEGIAEYQAATTYYIGSIVKAPGSFNLYGSLIDNNVGNALPAGVSNANWQYLGNLGNLASQTSVPVGAMQDFGGASAPTGYLLCDGSGVSRTTYSALFSVIGVAWGAGDGVNTFNLPDFRRRVAVGSGGTGSSTLGNAVGNVGGEEAHVLTIMEMPSHSHTDTGHFHSVSGSGGSGGGVALFTGNAGSSLNTSTSTANLTNTGNGAAHNIIQPSAVVLKIIKF